MSGSEGCLGSFSGSLVVKWDGGEGCVGLVGCMCVSICSVIAEGMNICVRGTLLETLYISGCRERASDPNDGLVNK